MRINIGKHDYRYPNRCYIYIIREMRLFWTAIFARLYLEEWVSLNILAKGEKSSVQTEGIEEE